MKLIVHNDVTHIVPNSMDTIRLLDEKTSYRVKGYFFTRTYKKGLWDGKQHLLKFNRTKGYTIPTGMLRDVFTIFAAHGIAYDLEDKRKEPAVENSIQSRKQVDFRYYQDDAIVKATSDTLLKARCILKMPIRSGKTLTTAEIINRLKVKTLFIVTDEMLLTQTLQVFRDYFTCPIGQVGSGEWDEQAITVATAQTLTRRSKTKEFKHLINSAGLIVFDECHHLVGKKWRDILLTAPAKYRIGLSATAFLAQKGENERTTIWLKATCGPIIHEVSISELIDTGFLVPLNVVLIPINAPEVKGGWRASYEDGVVRHGPRNDATVKIAIESAENGNLVLVHAIRLDHIHEIATRLKQRGAKFNVMIGATKPENRRKRVSDFTSGTVPILVGNLFKEGVDIPQCDVVINAAGGKSEISTIQRLRNLTIHDGKREAYLYDFSDMHNTYLAKHALERYRVYKAESGFTISMRVP